MNARWLVVTLLLHSAVPALAQLGNDPENPPVVHNDTPTVPKNAVPASQVNAGSAAVSPVGGVAHAKPQKSDCPATNPCAIPTPAAR